MTILSVPTFPSDRFTPRRDHNGMSFVAEASELSRLDLPFKQLYDDAADVGLAVQSRKTGKVVRYALYETTRDADQDVLCWVLLPIPEDVRAIPACRDTSVVIFND